MPTHKLQALPETKPVPHPVIVDIDCCSMCDGSHKNTDYALYDRGVGICVADGVSMNDLGYALARLACHIAMEALHDGRSASAALRAAGAEVAKFASVVDSPGSGTDLLVARLDCDTLDVAWAGDVGLFALPRATDNNIPLSNLGGKRPYGPLGIGLAPRHGTLALPLDEIDKFAVCTNGAWRSVGVDDIAKFLAEDATSTKIAAHIALTHHTSHGSTAVVARIKSA